MRVAFWLMTVAYMGLAGKRYRTKKERMRMGRGGPPLAADGSLDYPESKPYLVYNSHNPFQHLS